ncbi:MAG TPA: hypothetical protein VLC95_13115 [Anaerolineae bacterium]|nr:hypothetical protein [Anaerolineae bacterium]
MPTLSVTLKAILWPLAGAGLLLVVAALPGAMGSFVPAWLRRIVAATAAAAALLTITMGIEQGARVTIPWQPLNLFRTGPTFQFDSLSIPVVIVVSGVTAAMLLGIRGRAPGSMSWHGLALVALAGVMVMAAAGNMLALLLGSAVVDLALIATLLFSVNGEGEERSLPLTVALPGLASTMLLFFAAVQVDAEVGHASLQALNLPESTLILTGAAGALRLMVFPFHPRGVSRPEDAALLLLPAAAGIYLIGRVQHIAPILSSGGWLAFTAAGALLVGGLALWSGLLALASGSRHAAPGGQPIMGEVWPAALIHRAGAAIFFLLFVPGAPLWPLLGTLLPLAVLVVCWDLLLDESLPPRARWIVTLQERMGPWWQERQARITARWQWIERTRAFLDRSRGWRLDRYLLPLVLILAFGSLLGFPLTIGMRDRWPLYAALLRQQSPWLIPALIADLWLAAGVWRVARSRPLWLRRDRSPGALSLFALFMLGLAIIAVGLFPRAFGVSPAGTGRVSGWGLGFLLLLPWLVGAWLAGLNGELERYAGIVRRVLACDWLYAGAGRVAAAVLGLFYWLGRVAEGAGWWGWALIVLALAAVLGLHSLAVR